MRNTTTKRRKDASDGDDSTFIVPDKTFLGASETDIIALEREIRSATTSRRRAKEGPNPDRRQR
jgi:hypothetical protein